MTFRKLLLLNASTTGLTVLLLASYFPSEKLGTARTALEHKGMAHSRLLADRVAASWADGHRPVMRELVGSIAADADVGNVLLLPAADDMSPNRANHAPYVLEFSDRIALVSSVASDDGPRGTLIVELSTRSLEAARADVTRTLVVGASIAMALGILLTFLIARAMRAMERQAGRERAVLLAESAEREHAMEAVFARGEPTERRKTTSAA